MKLRPFPNRLRVLATLGLALVLVSGLSLPVQASTEDVAMFHEELAQYGQWMDYENYGPVWYPNQVEEGWRPYANGRWVPSEQGYLFESQEPWSWATYHYGNWMPTQNYGWVWSPGRTWYPHTVSWRTSEEYVGWAPVPPPNYVPPPQYSPPGGYYPGRPAADLLTAPFFIFARAASFLLGFGQPFAPGYSYNNCGCLAPPAFVPVCYQRTLFLNNYFVNPFYPRGFFAFGPPFPWITRVAQINTVTFNNVVRDVRLNQIHNVVPPAGVLDRRAGLRQIVPEALAHGKSLPLPKQAPDVKVAQANLARPNVAALPKDAPRLTAQIPKASTGMTSRGRAAGDLPPKAAHELTPQMSREIKSLPQAGSRGMKSEGPKAAQSKGVKAGKAPEAGRSPAAQKAQPRRTPEVRGGKEGQRPPAMGPKAAPAQGRAQPGQQARPKTRPQQKGQQQKGQQQGPR